MMGVHRQASYSLRFDWGASGAAAISAGARVAVIVDVLSFTTTLSVALERGVRVYPYRWHGGAADRYARERGAAVAVGRSQAKPGQVTLSPASLRTTTPPR